MTNPLYIATHLGLGDAIIVNGLVRVLARKHELIIFPAKRHNFETVAWMFSDLENVTVVPVNDDADMINKSRGFDALKLGVHSGDYKIPKDWDAWFYRQADVPHECRWSEFKLPTSVWCHAGKTWDGFIHDDLKRRYLIRPDTIAPQALYCPDPSKPFSDHIWPLQTASEIHVIDSSFLCLADTIETQAKRLVLHQYATANDPYKKLGPPTLRKNWEILK